MKAETAYSYLRFSKPEQIKGDSIRRQTSQTEALCERNGWVLNSTLTDKGLSAWSGKNAKQGALSVFLAGVESGKIPTPCVLVVEQIDRITRQAPLDAVALIGRLLAAGVSIAVFRPNERIYTRKNARETAVVMELIFTLCLAFDESEKKSERLKAAWSNKRTKADKVLTARVPKWLEVVEGKIVPIPEKVKVVRRIVRMSIEGLGDGMIAKTLNMERIPTLTGEGTWHGASINKNILRCRSLIGEYQPNRMQGGKRIPDGAPRQNYYPAVISTAEWSRMQAAIDGRKFKRGRVGQHCANLFQGLMVDAANNGPIILRTLGGGAKRKYFSMLANSLAERGGGEGLRFPYPLFESSFMGFVGELLAKDMVPPSSDGKAASERLAALQGRLTDIDTRLAVFHARLLNDDGFEALLTAIKSLEEEKKHLQAELRAAKQAAQQPACVDLLEEAKELATELRYAMETTTGAELLSLRLKLRAVIRSLIGAIHTRILETTIDGKTARVIFAEIHFRSGAIFTIISLHWYHKRGDHTPFYYCRKWDANPSPRIKAIKLLDERDDATLIDEARWAYTLSRHPLHPAAPARPKPTPKAT